MRQGDTDCAGVGGVGDGKELCFYVVLSGTLAVYVDLKKKDKTGAGGGGRGEATPSPTGGGGDPEDLLGTFSLSLFYLYVCPQLTLSLIRTTCQPEAAALRRRESGSRLNSGGRTKS